MKTLTIATRGSALALWQAHWVRDRLRAADPMLAVELLVLKTRGDQIVDRPLSEAGGKGLFVKEIEEALLDRRADLAVHSLKDLPALLPDGLVVAAIPEREDPRDALVVAPAHAARSIAGLPPGARVGTSSLRRACQLRAARRDLEIVALRGNVDTRLAKLGRGELDAIVLACAGLQRLGRGDAITAALSTAESLPAIGQGALALECRSDDAEIVGRLGPLHHRDTARAVVAERAFLRRLAGDCRTPLGGHAVVSGERLELEGLVGAVDGSQLLRERASGPVDDGERLGTTLAETLLARGAARLLQPAS